MPKCRIRWSMMGISYVEAESEDEAEIKFDSKEPSELLNDIPDVEIYDTEEA